jgi:hypothetical protein
MLKKVSGLVKEGEWRRQVGVSRWLLDGKRDEARFFLRVGAFEYSAGAFFDAMFAGLFFVVCGCAVAVLVAVMRVAFDRRKRRGGAKK